MLDFSPWLSELYELNLQDTVVIDSLEKVENLVAQIVTKTKFAGITL